MPVELRIRTKFFIIFFLLITSLASGTTPAAELYQTAEKQMALPDYNEASRLFTTAIKICDNKKDFTILTKSLIRLGQIFLIHSDFKSAKSYTGKSIALLESIHYPGATEYQILADGYHTMGNIYANAGDIEIAGKYYQKEYDLIRRKIPYDSGRKATALTDLSSYHSFKVQIDSEYHYAAQAYGMISSLESIPLVKAEVLTRYAYATKVFKRGGSYHFDDCYPLVRKILTSAIGIYDQCFNKPSIQKAEALQALANSYADYVHLYPFRNSAEKKTYYKKAESIYKDVLKLKVSMFGASGPSIATTCYTLALLNRAVENNPEAHFWYRKAIAALDDSLPQAGYWSDIRKIKTNDPYQLDIILTNLITLLWENYHTSGNDSLMYKIHEANLSRVALWRQLYESHESRDLGNVIALWNHAPFEEAVRSSYELYRLTGNKRYLNDIYYLAEESRNNDLNREKREKTKNENSFISFEPDVLALDSVIRLATSTKSAFISYLSPDTDGPDGYGVLICKEGLFIHPFDVKRADSLVQSYLNALKQNSAEYYEKNAFNLYCFTLGPLLNQLHSPPRNLIISAGPQFKSVSFESLVTKESKLEDFRKLYYLNRNYVISYSLSCSMLHRQSKLTPSRNRSMTVFYPEISKLPSLIFSGQLFIQLKKSYQGNFFNQADASRINFINHTGKQMLLQLFTHARSNRQQYGQSALYLSGNPVDSVTIDDIYKTKIHSDLTVLAACETGFGPNNYGEGPKSMERAFIASGSKSVISTLWPVDEKATMDILARFYPLLEKGRSIASALRQTKLEYLKSCKSSSSAHPFFWSGVVFTGSPLQEIHPESNKPLWLYAAITTILIAVLLLFWKGRG